MGFLLIDPPSEVNLSAKAMERWIARLRELREQYADDPEIQAQLDREISDSEDGLKALRERDRQGIPPPLEGDTIEPDE